MCKTTIWFNYSKNSVDLCKCDLCNDTLDSYIELEDTVEYVGDKIKVCKDCWLRSRFSNGWEIK